MKIKKLLALLLLTGSAFAHSVTLHWTPGAANSAVVDHFKIKRSLVPGGPYTVMGIVPAVTLSFVNGSNPDGTPLVEGQNYCYVVTAISGTTESNPSNEVCGIIPATPAAPVGLNGTIQ